MKHLINATTLALGLVCAGGVSAAQDEIQTQATNMRDVTVNAGQYETYSADLDTGYTLHALVGNNHRQYVQARRAADSSEALRKSGIAAPAHIAVAIDNASGPGVARQIRLIDPARNTVAIVNVYCKRVMPSGGPRCRLDPLPMSASSSQRLASAQAEYLQIAQADLRD
ncbi:hypothetical protein ACPPVV_12045 [Rhodanobacter sp. Col0626]|uniref:hypothetical protein n=1 Tax=Rhodanobacter sp. Col0626 TaxID=3415679 RepID=UPI003CEAC6F1